MNKWINKLTALSATLYVLCSTAVNAAALFNIVPNSISPITVYPTVDMMIRYSVTNNTRHSINNIKIEPGFGMPSGLLAIGLQQDTCSNKAIVAGGACSFQLVLRGLNQASNMVLMPRICSNGGLLCSVPIESQRIPITLSASQDPLCTMHTNMGDIRVRLFYTQTPNTVTNFLYYVNSGEYINSVIHRSIPNFVIQGGGYQVDFSGAPRDIETIAPIQSEAGIHNTRGTMAMALSTGPDSATSQWYFNLKDNPHLDGPAFGGPFTVFGQVADSASLAVVNSISHLSTYDERAVNLAFSSIPLINYLSGIPQYKNYVLIQSFSFGED